MSQERPQQAGWTPDPTLVAAGMIPQHPPRADLLRVLAAPVPRPQTSEPTFLGCSEVLTSRSKPFSRKMDPKVEKSSDLEQQGLWGGDAAGRGEAWRSRGGVTGAALRGEGVGRSTGPALRWPPRGHSPWAQGTRKMAPA